MLTSILVPDYVRVGKDLKKIAGELSYSQRLELLKYDRFCDIFLKQLQDHGAPEFFPDLLNVVQADDDLWGERLNISSLSFSDYVANYLDDLEEKIQVFFEIPQVPKEDLEDPDLHFHIIRRRIIWTNVKNPDILSWDGDQLSKGFLWHPETKVAISLYKEEFQDEKYRIVLFILKP